MEPAADLSVAMAAAIERLEGEGWQSEGSAEYGFVFIRRAGDRRLLMLTQRDPREHPASHGSKISRYWLGEMVGGLGVEYQLRDIARLIRPRNRQM